VANARSSACGSVLQLIDRLLDQLVAGTAILALPLSLLLFLQWPLRELVQAWSREANDLAQCVFAVYAATAVTQATRRNAHLAVDAYARRYADRTRSRVARLAALLIALPWACFVLWWATPGVVRSLAQLELFPETFNPGYFLIRVATWLLALLVALQALLDAAGLARHR
jgi:TRAP-type mannitol/chloroaromatic compound transport system permease small subunit